MKFGIVRAIVQNVLEKVAVVTDMTANVIVIVAYTDKTMKTEKTYVYGLKADREVYKNDAFKLNLSYFDVDGTLEKTVRIVENLLESLPEEQANAIERLISTAERRGYYGDDY